MKKCDYLTFKYRMHNGAEGDSFRTTDLECTNDRYVISRQGRLMRVTTTNRRARPIEDLNYTGWLDISSLAGDFRLSFVAGSLSTIQLMNEEVLIDFDPDRFVS